MRWETGTRELAPGVFAYVQATGGRCIANAGLVAGPADACAVDALFTRTMTRAFLAEAARLSRASIRCLINTHHHVDHMLGNAGFPPETEIVAHVRAKEEMERVGLPIELLKRFVPNFAGELADASLRLPDVTFDGGALEITAGGRRLRLLHFGTAHTRGDVLVLLPEERILFAGDVAFFHVQPLAFEGHIGNWRRIAGRIIDEVDAGTIVPGHGPVGTKDDLRAMLGYLDLLDTHARAAYDAGVPVEEAVRTCDLGAYAGWGEADRVEPNIARLYAEFRGELDAVL
ncbi:MAG: MBL fold metallo-hydrolase [Chloroflexota bacterium]|nr:MBL fold metallo-hydrolase [Chloroflexota bacterium]